jgi:hypothetical protein
VLLALVVVVAGVLSWPALRRDCLLRGPAAPRRLLWDDAGRFWLERAGGRRELLPCQCCGAWIVGQAASRRGGP